VPKTFEKIYIVEEDIFFKLFKGEGAYVFNYERGARVLS